MSTGTAVPGWNEPPPPPLLVTHTHTPTQSKDDRAIKLTKTLKEVCVRCMCVFVCVSMLCVCV